MRMIIRRRKHQPSRTLTSGVHLTSATKNVSVSLEDQRIWYGSASLNIHRPILVSSRHAVLEAIKRQSLEVLLGTGNL